MESNNKIWVLFCVFFKISLVTLGGGLAMMPIVQQEFTEKRAWMTSQDMLDTLAVIQAMPGIIAMNMGVLVGYKIAGIPGAISAAFGSVLPPFIVIIMLVGAVMHLRKYPSIAGLFLGIRAGVAAIVLAVAIKLWKKSCAHWLDYLLVVGAFLLIGILRFNAVWVVLAAMCIGPFVYFIKNRKDRNDIS